MTPITQYGFTIWLLFMLPQSTDSNKQPLALCLFGPTASGKTDLALQLADQYQAEIISVDSALIYRQMDIGTAKPSPEILARYPHHLINILDPKEHYSAAQFCIDATTLINDCLAHQKLPLLVGGTMLYFKALQQGLAPLPSQNIAIRERISQQAATYGWASLHAELSQLDPAAGLRIHPNDPQRIQRALEIYYLTGQPMSQHWQQTDDQLPAELTHEIPTFRWLNIGLLPTDRAQLHQRIANRFMQMLAQGFLDEVKQLMDRGDLTPDLPAIRAVGYRQAWAYLQGEISEQQMIEQAIAATRQLAKRQMTWIRSWPDVNYFDPFNQKALPALLALPSCY